MRMGKSIIKKEYKVLLILFLEVGKIIKVEINRIILGLN